MRRAMNRAASRPLLALLLLLAPLAAPADPALRELRSPLPYAELLLRLRAAVAAEGMGLVTEAGPTEVAAARGVMIPGDRVLGVFRNDFAVRAVRACPQAMIEAPARFHLREDPEGGSILSWKPPGAVFGAYEPLCGPAIAALGRELDPVFEAIAARALAP